MSRGNPGVYSPGYPSYPQFSNLKTNVYFVPHCSVIFHLLYHLAFLFGLDDC